MATVIVSSGRIVNAKGTFLQGERISGKGSDLKPLVDSGAARWEGEVEWTLATSPKDYLERWPTGPRADLAREVLGQDSEPEEEG